MSSTIGHIMFAFLPRFTIVSQKANFIDFLKTDFYVNSESPCKLFFNILYSRDLQFFLFIRVIDSPQDEGEGFFNQALVLQKASSIWVTYDDFSRYEMFRRSPELTRAATKNPFPSSEVVNSYVSSNTNPSFLPCGIVKRTCMGEGSILDLDLQNTFER